MVLETTNSPTQTGQSTPARPRRTRPSTSFTGAPGEFRPPKYSSPIPRLPSGDPYPSAGPKVGKFIQDTLAHGEGDSLGRAVRLLLFQWFILHRIYEFDPRTGKLAHDRVLIIMPKGNSKTELIGQVGDAEMLGPLAPLSSARVTVSAASWKQADELLNAAKLGIKGGPLGPRFLEGLHFLDDKILVPDEDDRRLERIAAVGGTADGGKETCHLGDELHEWKGDRAERMWTVKGKSLRKRRVPRRTCATCMTDLVQHRGEEPHHRLRSIDQGHRPFPIRGSMQIAITTTGDDPTVITEEPASLLGKLYRQGVKIATGEVEDPGFLFLSWEADEDWDLDNRAELEQAILQANPAVGGFLDLESKVASYTDTTVPRHEFRRYDLSHWTSAPDSWLELKTWMACRHRTYDAHGNEIGGMIEPPEGTEIAIGFDGSKSRDSTGLYGCTIDSQHIFKIGTWERPNGDPDWTVPRADVEAELVRAFKTWKVRHAYMDPPRWEKELEDWTARWPGRIVAWDTAVYETHAPAVGRFHQAVIDATLTHDGDVTLARHIANARQKETRWGIVIQKEHKDSPRKIDAAVAAVLAREASITPAANTDRSVHGWG